VLDKPKYLFDELVKVYNFFNRNLFFGKLKSPIFVFAPSKKYIFRFLPDSSEIVVGCGFESAIELQVLIELLHEMIHAKNQRDGIVDCKSNQYHNEHFLKSALELGFITGKSPRKGWNLIGLKGWSSNPDEIRFPNNDSQQKLLNVIRSIKLNKVILNKAKAQIHYINAKKKNTVFFLKYECDCPPPHNSIRSGRRPDGRNPLQVVCLICESEFKCVDIQ